MTSVIRSFHYCTKEIIDLLPRLSLQDRLDFANEMLSEVFDSAENPLTV